MSVESGGAADNVEPVAEVPQAPGAEAPRPQTPGELLREAREQRGVSVQQAADELHLDVKLINAIESNNFLLLGAPVYAKGHLRKYASVLGLAPDVVIARYQTLQDVPAAPTAIPVTAPPKPPRRVSLRVPAYIVAGLLVAALALWLAGWLLDRFGSGAPQSANQTAVTLPAAVEPADAPASDTLAVEATPTGSPAAESQAQPVAAAATTAPVATDASVVRLRLQFASPSWAEVYDADGRRLMFDIGQQGQSRMVSGSAPLRVNLGVASAVTVEVNDRPVAVPRRAGRDAARFRVAADGAVSPDR